MYIDTVLPFGLRSAPKIFNAVADAVEWVVHSNGAAEICHYLDDILVAGAPGSSQCTESSRIVTVHGELQDYHSARRACLHCFGVLSGWAS